MSRNGWCVEESAGGPDRDRPGPRPRRAKIASCPTWMVPTTICPSTIFFPTFFLLPLYAPKTAEGAQAVAQSGERRRFIFSGCPVPPYVRLRRSAASVWSCQSVSSLGSPRPPRSGTRVCPLVTPGCTPLPSQSRVYSPSCAPVRQTALPLPVGQRQSRRKARLV